QTGNPMDVHINTGANTRRYVLRQPELSLRTKLRALLVWHTGPEVMMVQRMLAADVQPEPARVAALPPRAQDELLDDIATLIARLPVGERLPTANLATWRCTDEVKQAAALAQQYANAGYAAEPLITLLGTIACRDNFTEMHALKHHQATFEEFYATRPSLRWRHLVAAVQAAALSHGRIQEGWEHAAEVMEFARWATSRWPSTTSTSSCATPSGHTAGTRTFSGFTRRTCSIIRAPNACARRSSRAIRITRTTSHCSRSGTTPPCRRTHTWASITWPGGW